MRQRHLLTLVVLVAVAANALGYFVFRARRAEPAAHEPAPPPATRTSTATQDRPTEELLEREKQGQALRQNGYQALLEGNYDKALIQLTEARAHLADKSSVDDLLRVTEQLRAKAQAAQGPPPAAAPATAAPPAEARREPDAPTERSEARPRPVRRVAAVRSNEREPRPEPTRAEPPRATSEAAAVPTESTGLLLVTSTPRGLLVHVDGVPSDLTPMRAAVAAGPHRVSLHDGDRKLFETRVEVTGNRPTTIIKDLSQELAAPPPVPPAAAGTTPPPLPEAAATERTPKPPEPPAVPATTRGGLAITSPGLYAEVWVNGRPYGFPPATVEDLPGGPAQVELRINGVVKRARAVTVEPGKVTPVRLSK